MTMVPYWFAKLCKDFSKTDNEERQRYAQPQTIESCRRWINWRERGYQTLKELKDETK